MKKIFLFFLLIETTFISYANTSCFLDNNYIPENKINENNTYMQNNYLETQTSINKSAKPYSFEAVASNTKRQSFAELGTTLTF